MGIDVYATWAGMTPQERALQYTGFSVINGEVGYLREAYHGSPYATRVLVPEAFEWMNDGYDPSCTCEVDTVPTTIKLSSREVTLDIPARCEHTAGAPIAAEVLRERLPKTIATAIERERSVYGNVTTEDDDVVRAFIDFVELCERKEEETGEPVRILASY